MATVRVRFAPSPTGYLHIGGVRTALFNYLYAKSLGGVFLLRIEDTDLERSKPEYEREILNSLEWLGLAYDEKLAKQSEHFPLYAKIADELVAQGKATVSTEKGGRAVVLKNPRTTVQFDDMVHGRIEFDSSVLEDLVLIKSDGSPTYNFACVIDDHLMNVTHVIRGDDHISNTPKQILLYQTLGYPVPQFGHLPLIVGSDGAPLSKRHGSVSLPAYQEEGFLPQGLLNYLALLGWSGGDNRELYTLEELIKSFRMEQVNSTSACFDNQKLRWLNGEHVRLMALDDFCSGLSAYLKNYAPALEPGDGESLRRAAALFKDRIKTFKEFTEQADYFFKKDIIFDPAALEKHWQDPKVRERLEALFPRLAEASFGEPSALEKLTRETAAQLGVSAGALIHPMRVALTGKSVSPGIFELMIALGREKVLDRLRYALETFGGLKGNVHG